MNDNAGYLVIGHIQLGPVLQRQWLSARRDSLDSAHVTWFTVNRLAHCASVRAKLGSLECDITETEPGVE